MTAARIAVFTALVSLGVASLGVTLFSVYDYCETQRFTIMKVSDQLWVVLDRRTGRTKTCLLLGCVAPHEPPSQQQPLKESNPAPTR